MESKNRPGKANKIVWTKEMDSLLGEMADRRVAQRLGIRVAAVRNRRTKLGIASKLRKGCKPRPQWTPEMDRLLGTMPDTQLAAQLRTSRFHVDARRRELGIPTYVAPPVPESTDPHTRLELDESRIALLGTTNDRKLAQQWGVTDGTVVRARQRLGIPAFKSVREVEWTREMVYMLGQASDNQVARELEISASCVKLKRIELGIFPHKKKHMDPEPDLPLFVIELLGKMPDKQISDLFKVNRLKLRVYRALHRIPAAEYSPAPFHNWSPQDDALLGTMKDSDVARKLGIPRPQVAHRRRVKGVAAFNRNAPVRWTKKKIARLGTEPDHQLAREWKFPQAVIRKKRESLGITACSRNTREWTEEEVQMLGKDLDTEVARRLGVSPDIVAKKRKQLGIAPLRSSKPYVWKKKDLKRLGTMPDDILATELGLSYQFIHSKRASLGIPAYRRGSERWTPSVIKRMGVVSDRVLAKELGCSPALVYQKRKALGIPAYRKTE